MIIGLHKSCPKSLCCLWDTFPLYFPSHRAIVLGLLKKICLLLSTVTEIAKNNSTGGEQSMLGLTNISPQSDLR